MGVFRGAYVYEIFGDVKGGPPLPSSERTGKLTLFFEETFSIKIFWFLGADPQTGCKMGERYGGICSAHVDLQDAVKKYAKMSRTTEILRVEKKPLAPPSGQTGNKLGEGPT